MVKMRDFKRIITALLLALSLAISALSFIPHTEVGAAGTILVYSTESNSGTRHVLCTTLDGTGASEYYTDSYTYDKLDDLSSDDLYDALQALMISTHKKRATYDDCRDMAHLTDCENNDGRINLIYSSKSVTRSDYQNGTGWNREHVWPKSLGKDSTTGGGADLHHVRPCDNRLNTVRNNNMYGNVNGGKAATGGSLVGNSFVGGYYANGYFEPLDNVKGDVARICLYMYVRWETDWNCGSVTQVFESIDVLLEWCKNDPVDTWEMGRNEVVSAYQGNRNVFIDYPELAWLIFDREIPEGMTTPSGSAPSGDTSCSHSLTEIRNKAEGNCGSDGYTGDTYCKDCGKKLITGVAVSATGDHSFENVCDASCDICGYVRTVTHSYRTDLENDEMQHWRVCAVCNAADERSDHVYYNACDTSCNVCSYVRNTTHSYRTDWSSNDEAHWHPCSVCGLADEKASHEFSSAQDESCNVCGHIRLLATEHLPTVKPSTTAPSITAPSTTAPPTTVPSTTPDLTTSPTASSTAGAGETTSGETDFQKRDGAAFIAENAFFIICVLILLCAVSAIVFKKTK